MPHKETHLKMETAENQHLKVSPCNMYTSSQERSALNESTNGGSGEANTNRSILGSCFGLLSGFLYVTTNAIVGYFDMNFFDSSLPRYVLQCLACSIILTLSQCMKTTTAPTSMVNEGQVIEQTNQNGQMACPLWIYEVDDGKNLHLMQHFW